MTRNDQRSFLIDAGLKAFLRAGYSDTGIKDIVDAADVPKGSFYYYFDSKEAFAAAVVDRYAELNGERRHALLLGDRRTAPLKRLRSYFEGYAGLLKDAGYVGGCLLGNLSAEVADHSPAVRERLTFAFASWQGTIVEVLDEAKARGDLPNGLEPHATGAFLINAWEGALVRMKAEKTSAPLTLFIDIVFNQLLRMSE